LFDLLDVIARINAKTEITTERIEIPMGIKKASGDIVI